MTVHLDFEKSLWAMADKRKGTIDQIRVYGQEFVAAT